MRSIRVGSSEGVSILRRTLCAWIGAAALVSCAGLDLSTYEVQRQSVQSFDVPAGRLRKDQAFGEIANILVNRGFDLKMSNKESGLITTEFKKYASYGSSPPFDYYLQLRVTIRDAGGKTTFRMSPIVKEQNRLNAAAFTERELFYFEGAPDGVRVADKQGAASQGQTVFMNVIADVSERAGVRIEDVVRNVTTVKYNALIGPPSR